MIQVAIRNKGTIGGGTTNSVVSFGTRCVLVEKDSRMQERQPTGLVILR